MLVSYGERLEGAWRRDWRKTGDGMEEASEHTGDFAVTGWWKNRFRGSRGSMDGNCFTGCFTDRGEM